LAFIGEKIAKIAKANPSQNLADLMVFSRGSPNQLRSCLESSYTNLLGIHQIHVIYDCNQETFMGYEALKKEFPHVNFIRPSKYVEAGFKDSFLSIILENTPSYVLLSTDEVTFKESVLLSACIEAMRKTRAYGFYFHLGREGTVPDGVYMWDIERNEGPFGSPDTLKMGLYRRLNLEKEIKALTFSSVQGLISAWSRTNSTYRVGLSFRDPKVVTPGSCAKPFVECEKIVGSFGAM